MSRLVITLLLIAGLSIGCSKQDEQKPAAPASSAAPTNSPLQLTITNATPSAPVSMVRSNTLPSGKIERGYAVRDTGNLFLTFPKTWKDSIFRMQDEKSAYDAVRFLPTDSKDFQMMIDFHHPPPELYAAMDLKAQLVKMGQGELTNSIEKSLDIREFSGPQINGYYFMVTDKNYNQIQPATNDFPYLTQGYAKLGGMIIGFRLVSDQLSPVSGQMLEMLKTARVEKKP